MFKQFAFVIFIIMLSMSVELGLWALYFAFIAYS